jgi:hypothetical protein
MAVPRFGSPAISGSSPDEAQRSHGMGEQLGEFVLAQAVELAASAFGKRLVAAYALGSLAHGGFSVHVSDVDLGLVLGDPLEDGDAARIETIVTDLRAGGAPLADRLSLFWGTLATLSGAAAGGRYPPVDRLDLKEFGRLIVGTDIREELSPPTLRELVVSAAQLAVKSLLTPQASAALLNPLQLIEAGVRTLTKRILFPVRFVYTARTGQIGRNEAAMEYFTSAESGPAAALARKGFEWRYEPPDPGDPEVLEIVRRGLLPLYRLFAQDYEARLQGYGELELALAFRKWQRDLQ